MFIKSWCVPWNVSSGNQYLEYLISVSLKFLFNFMIGVFRAVKLQCVWSWRCLLSLVFSVHWHSCSSGLGFCVVRGAEGARCWECGVSLQQPGENWRKWLSRNCFTFMVCLTEPCQGWSLVWSPGEQSVCGRRGVLLCSKEGEAAHCLCSYAWPFNLSGGKMKQEF